MDASAAETRTAALVVETVDAMVEE